MPRFRAVISCKRLQTAFVLNNLAGKAHLDEPSYQRWPESRAF
ncbi:MAG: hypothetical protein WBG92_14390 [Thiohalocapsa sp.]